MVMDDPDDPGGEECEPLDESSALVVPPVQSGEPAALRVSIVQSPVLHTFHHQHPVQLTLDTGATSNMVRASPAQLYGFPTTRPPKWLVRLMESPQWMSLAKSTAP